MELMPYQISRCVPVAWWLKYAIEFQLFSFIVTFKGCKYYRGLQSTQRLVPLSQLQSRQGDSILAVYVLKLLNLMYNADTIGLRELCLELHTVDDWLHLGIYLGIPYTELKAIDAVHYREPHRCRTEMLAFWLNNFQPSWSALIEALELIGMNQLAREMTASHIQKSVNSQKGAESTHRQRLRPVCSPTNELETVV